MKKFKEIKRENGSILVLATDLYAIVTKKVIYGPFAVGRIGDSFTVSTSEESITLRDLRRIQLKLRPNKKRGILQWLA